MIFDRDWPRKTKLTIEKAREIRQLYRSGEWKQKDLAKKFGVTAGVVSNVVNGLAWTEPLNPSNRSNLWSNTSGSPPETT